MDIDEQARIAVLHRMQSREAGPLHMRFPADPDTTQRLKRLHLDPVSEIPWWRRLVNWIRGF